MTVPDREALLEHLAPLFALAQVLTLNAEAAEYLVTATYRRARGHMPPDAPGERRAWLMGLMLNAYDEQVEADGHPENPGVEADLRGRLAQALVEQALPAAFAALPPAQRLLLALSDLEGMGCAEMGALLGLKADTACTRLEAARKALTDVLYANATEVEQHLLGTALPPGWQADALRHLAETTLIPLPPTLGSSVLEAAEEAADDAPLPPPRLTAAPPPAATPPVVEKKRGRTGRFLWRMAVALLLIGAVGLLGYGLSVRMQEAPETNLIVLSATHARQASATTPLSSPEQAEGYVRDRLGWRLIVPGIDEAELTGLDVAQIIDGIEVPVFLYQDVVGGAPTVVYAFTYALLQRHAERLQLAPDVLRQIEEEGYFDLHDLGDEKVLVWRNRDDIFVAVTRGDAEALRDRIYFPS